MCAVKLCIYVLLFIITVQLVECKCRQSFTTVCDSFQDLKNITKTGTVTELIIGSEKSIANESVNIMKELYFSKYSRLINLYIINKIKNLKMTYAFECTYNSKHLNLVSFYGNNFKNIQEYHFPQLAARKFSIVNNKIETIKGGAFNHLEVEIFDLSDNLMEVIEAGSLPKTDRIRTITAKNNRLNFIEPGTFHSTLQTLNLDHNNLRHLSNEIVKDLTNLQELTLSNNKFKEIPNVSNMTELIFLDVSFNDITSVPRNMFEQLNKMLLLDLSYNKIVNKDVLNSVIGPNKPPSLTISIAFNRLTKLNLTGISFRRETLVLFGNPWDCQTWNQMQNNLIPRQSECDKKYFTSGTIPYCLDSTSQFLLFAAYWDEHIDRFQDTIKTSQSEVDCNLVLEQYRAIDAVISGCVA